MKPGRQDATTQWLSTPAGHQGRSQPSDDTESETPEPGGPPGQPVEHRSSGHPATPRATPTISSAAPALLPGYLPREQDMAAANRDQPRDHVPFVPRERGLGANGLVSGL